MKQKQSFKITKISSREILDSRGNPTLETTVWSGGFSATASVPSGASTGSHEALELRDGDSKRYAGRGVLKAVANVEKKIFPVLKGVSVLDQVEIDARMCGLDGTEHKSKLGANAILSVSLASARLGSLVGGKPLYHYLNKMYVRRVKVKLPIPLFNVINGGKHADSGLDIQEFMLIPQRGKFQDRLRMAAEVYYELKRLLSEKGFSVGVGDEGGFAPHLGANQKALHFLADAIRSAGYVLGKDFKLGIDAAATEFFDSEKELYQVKASKAHFKPVSMYKLYAEWVKSYHLALVEDGCSEDDVAGWQELTKQLGKKTILVGDDLFVTDYRRIKKGVEQGIANAALIKPNQIGTLTETLAAIQMAQMNNYQVIISHRSGETVDDFIADLAVGVGADYIKTGSVARSERLAKYNRLSAIEKELNSK